MRTLPAGLAAHLASGATTLCWCWRLTRRDGVRLGFTDHDGDLTFDGTLFEAATGFTTSDLKEGVGLGVDNLEVSAALVSGSLDEASLAAGDYDDAEVEIFRVNWQSLDQRVLLRLGSIGEVRRGTSAFTAEIRGLAHYLQQPQGRLVQHACDATLGDTRCGVDLSSAVYRGTGVVMTAIGDRTMTVSGLTAFEDAWFTRGRLAFTSGPNAGRAGEVKRHAVSGATVTIELWHPVTAPVAAGHAFSITAGCDKHLATCADKFANAARFRGFPHVPGNDFLATYPRPGDSTNTGQALVP